MKLRVDAKRCELHGQCAFVAPELFRLEDDALRFEEQVPVSLEDKARKAAKACPQLAISLVDD